jgi:hypothetical protein
MGLPAVATGSNLAAPNMQDPVEARRGDFLRPDPEAPDRPAFTHAYIFFADDARSLSAALLLQRLLRARFEGVAD